MSDRAFRANPLRRYLLGVALGVVVPAIALAWLLSSFVLMRISSNIVHAGSSEVTSHVAGLLQQSGLATDMTGEAIVVNEPARGAADAWGHFGALAQRNPNTVAVRAYDKDGRIVFATNPGLVGMQPTPDAKLSAALTGKRGTRFAASLFGSPSRSYATFIPLKTVAGVPAGVLEVVQDLGALRGELEVARWIITLGVLGISLAFLALLIPLLRRLALRSFIDPLTNLPNHAYLEAAAKHVFDRHGRSGRSVAVVLLDIDRFKAINDTLGRRHGDRMLVELAKRLKGQLRLGDYIARLGGDEFALVLPGASEGTAYAVVERLADAMKRPFRATGRGVHLDASIGVALFPRDGIDLHSLLQRAEKAMYRAKSLRLPMRFYRHGSDSRASHSIYLESDLREALGSGGLEQHYQAICRLLTGEVVAVEALARWQHPTLGRVPTHEFIALAEATGLAKSLDDWALAVAIRELARWSRSGSNVGMAVNLSAQSVSDPELPTRVRRLLEASQAPANQLILEITERSALEDYESSAGILTQLEALGVRIALDDFGTGHSSLSTLDRLPISSLKIDASFVRGIGRRNKDEHLIRALVEFSRGIDMPLVAEGIESEAQRSWLLAAGVEYGQGFLLAQVATAAQALSASSAGTLGGHDHQSVNESTEVPPDVN
ncbi:MAG: EAL domain-containing protein [Trueperaceae bacterium]|nr:EAL domain-containing protein [Trueperaceae bacterium]